MALRKHTYRWTITALLLLLPCLIYAGDVEGKKTFFPGRSWYFWIFSAAGFYLFYLYKNKKRLDLYLNKAFYKGMLINILLIFSCFMGVNIFVHEPTSKENSSMKQEDVFQKIREDNSLMKEAEQNFTDPYIHERYVNHHFTLPHYWKENGKVVLRDDYSLPNLYYDRLDFTDSSYVSMGYFGLGIFYFRIDSLEKAKEMFSAVKPYNTPFLNYYLGMIALETGDTAKGISYLEKSIKIKDKFNQAGYVALIGIYSRRNDYNALGKLIYLPAVRPCFSKDLAIKVYFKEGDLYNYYSVLLSYLFMQVNWLHLIAAFAIMLIWLLYIIRIDIFENEKSLPLLISLLAGMLSTFLVFMISDFGELVIGFEKKHFLNALLYYIINVGLVEELVKIIPLLVIMTFGKKLINEAYDYILYACISALGFSFVENLLYFQNDLSSIIYGRALTSVPAHMIFSSIVAYGFVLSKYRYKSFPVYYAFPLFLFLGALAHGLYDFWAFSHTLSIFLFHLLICVSIWIIIINNSINNSPHFSYRMKFKSENLQFYLSVALTSILALQYFILSLDQGPSSANSTLNSTLLIGGIFIVYYSDKLTNMDLVRGYWYTITYRSIAEKRRSLPFNLRMFFIRLISGDIIAHSFVGHKITLETDPENIALLMVFHRLEPAKIVDRLVITCVLKQTGEEYKDPYWFEIRTTTPILPGGGLHYFIRFLDDRPTFLKKTPLVAFLFTPRHEAEVATDIHHRNQLRSLGKVLVRREGKEITL